jgi:hypothetical protein
VKNEYKGKQVVNRDDILHYTKKNVYSPLKKVTHAPLAIVQTHRKLFVALLS